MSLEEALTAVEQHIEQVSGALLSLDAPALETASTALRDAAARFTWVLEQSKGISAAQLPPQFEQRLAAIGQQLAVQRDNLARVSVITDRQVAVVVPQAGSAQSATYGNPQAGPGKAGRGGAHLPLGRLSFLHCSLPVLRRRGYPVPGDLQSWRPAGQCQLE